MFSRTGETIANLFENAIILDFLLKSNKSFKWPPAPKKQLYASAQSIKKRPRVAFEICQATKMLAQQVYAMYHFCGVATNVGGTEI